MRHLWNIGWTLALLCACSESQDVTQTIVWLDAEPAARAKLTQLTVQSLGPGDSRVPEVEAKEPRWPIKLVFAPKYNDAARRFVLQIDARDEYDVRLVSLRLETGFVHDQTRHARLQIQDACADQPAEGCGAEEACHLWTRDVAANDLGRSASKARELNISCMPGEEPPVEPDPERPTETAGAEAPAGAGGGDAGAGGSGGSLETRPPANPSEMPSETCTIGFVRKAGKCEDVDECKDANPCGEHGRCENTPGAHVCTCDSGYEVQSGGCVDIDECKSDNAGCEVDCVNSTGGVACACPAAASWLKLDRKACGSFGDARKINVVPSGQPTQPRFAFDGEGNGLAVWTQFDGTRSWVYTRRYRAAEGWVGIPSRMTLPEAGNASAVRVALDGKGRGAVLWLQKADSLDNLWAARYTGQNFLPATKIDVSDAASVFDPVIALDAAGDGFAVWTQSDGTRVRIWSNRLSATDGWKGAQPIQNSASEEALGARISLDASGNASVAWTQIFYSEATGARLAPWIARYEASISRWTAPEALDDSDTAGAPDVALFEPSTRGMTVWTRATEGRTAVWARSHALPASAREAIKIAAMDSELWGLTPRIMLSPSGQGAAIWAQGRSSAYEVWANRYDGSADAWGEATLLSTQNSTSLPLPQIAVGKNGDGFAVWSEIDGTTRNVRAQRLQADIGFAGAVTLATDKTAESPVNSPPQVAIDAKGNAMAIWDVHDAGQYAVWAATFE